MLSTRRRQDVSRRASARPVLRTTARHLALFDSPTPASGTVLIIPVVVTADDGGRPGSGVASSLLHCEGGGANPVAGFLALACVLVVQAPETGTGTPPSEFGIYQ